MSQSIAHPLLLQDDVELDTIQHPENVDHVIESIRSRIRENLKSGIYLDDLEDLPETGVQITSSETADASLIKNLAPQKAYTSYTKGNTQEKSNLLVLKAPLSDVHDDQQAPIGSQGDLHKMTNTQAEPLTLGKQNQIEDSSTDPTEMTTAAQHPKLEDTSFESGDPVMTIGDKVESFAAMAPESPVESKTNTTNSTVSNTKTPDFPASTDDTTVGFQTTGSENTNAQQGADHAFSEHRSQKTQASHTHSATTSRIENLLSQETLKSSANAFAELSSVAREVAQHRKNNLSSLEQAAPLAPQNVGGYSVEGLMRELLKPMLKEWLDAYLPSLVKWIVTEQIEKMLQVQLGISTENQPRQTQTQNQSAAAEKTQDAIPQDREQVKETPQEGSAPDTTPQEDQALEK